MDYHAVSSERYSYDPSAQHIQVSTLPSDAQLPQVMGHEVASAYSLHYDYFVYPSNSDPTHGNFAYSPQGHAFPYEFSPPTQVSYPPDIPLYAPVPLSGHTALFDRVSYQQPHCAEGHLHSVPKPIAVNAPLYPAAPSDLLQQSNPGVLPSYIPASPPATVTPEENPLDYYRNAPCVTIQTPSELLTELTAYDERDVSPAPNDRSPDIATVTGGSEPNSSPTHTNVPDSTRRGSQQDVSSNHRQISMRPPANQRKAYFRAVADAVGFTPTDPDTISSHDKKRSYLECVEQYVQWLHDQIRLVGHEPAPLERVNKYRGLSSRSVRTILVHMQDEIRQLHSQTVEEEREYMKLQMQVSMQQASADARELRRHSIAAPPDTFSSMQPFLQSSSPTRPHIRKPLPKSHDF